MTLLSAIVVGFVLSGATVWLLLPTLQRLKLRQHAYEDAPQSHQVKTGTPTMGGIAFVVALLPIPALTFAAIAWLGGARRIDFSGVALFLLVLACAAIGFADDYSAIKRGKNAGLRARTKYLLTALAAAVFLWYIGAHLPFVARGVIFSTGNYALRVPFAVWMILGILAISGTIHAVNLTDGLDGLAAGTMVSPLIALAVVDMLVFTHVSSGYQFGMAFVSALGAGACLGFLLYNRHPAKVFMGDTGSLALGALLSGIAILSGEMLLLILIGGVFVAEALSVIIQVTYFKRTGGKRIFKMSPLHHHFELSGWPETTVTKRFWLASAICSAAGVAVVALAGAANVR